jgi:spore coat protein SA
VGYQTRLTKKNIAIVVPELLPVPPVKGGAVEHWVYEVVNRLNHQQFAVTVFSRPSGIVNNNDVSYVGIDWTPTERFFFWVKSRVSWRNPVRYLAKIQNVFSYGWRVANQLSGFDTVVVHNEPNILLFIKKQVNQTLMLHMHNDHLTHVAFRWLYRLALNKVDKVICVSQYIQDNATQYFPQHAHKFEVLINATDPEVFKPYGEEAKSHVSALLEFDNRYDYLLFVGRLTPEKGVDVLITAFKQVLVKKPNTKLIIAGSSFFEGAVKTHYQQQLVALAKPIHHAIHFTGFIPHEQLKYLYASVDVIVLPSVWQDPCPLVVLEAMASGTCLVASKVGGVPEIVLDNVNGFLVEANQPTPLANTIEYVLDYPAGRHRAALNARRDIELKHSWTHLVHQLSLMIEKSMQKDYQA